MERAEGLWQRRGWLPFHLWLRSVSRSRQAPDDPRGYSSATCVWPSFKGNDLVSRSIHAIGTSGRSKRKDVMLPAPVIIGAIVHLCSAIEAACSAIVICNAGKTPCKISVKMSGARVYMALRQWCYVLAPCIGSENPDTIALSCLQFWCKLICSLDGQFDTEL